MAIKDKIIIITGARRSGTTFLLDLLDGHPDLAVFPSDLRILYAYFPHYLSSKISKEKKILRLKKIIFDELKKELNRKKIKTKFNIRNWKKLFFKNIDKKKLNNIEHILKVFINSFKDSFDSRKKIIVIKETNLEINFSLLKKIFKNFKILRIQRDPRAAIASVKSGFKSHYSKIGDDFNISMLSDILREIIKSNILKTLPKSNELLTIKYEDLILSKNITITKICKFLKIKKSSSLFIQSKFSKEYQYKNFLSKKIKKFDKNRINSWKKILTKDEVIVIESFLGEIFKKYKYKFLFKKNNIIPVSRFYNKVNSDLFYKNKF